MSRLEMLLHHYQFDRIPQESTLFKSTYVATQVVDSQPVSTAIIGLYAHEPHSCSYFHRLDHDEVWHFYDGDPFHLYLGLPDGRTEIIKMGRNVAAGERLQAVVPAGAWQAGELISDGTYALFGCTVAPGFSGQIFTAGRQEELIRQFPHWKTIIRRLCPATVNDGTMPTDFR